MLKFVFNKACPIICYLAVRSGFCQLGITTIKEAKSETNERLNSFGKISSMKLRLDVHYFDCFIVKMGIPQKLNIMYAVFGDKSLVSYIPFPGICITFL